MRVWLDDIREMPAGYDKHVTTALSAMELINTGKVTHISFDHDLGDGRLSGYTVACCIEVAAHYNLIPKLTYNIHSANPVGRKNIETAMHRACHYWNNNE